MPVGNAFAAKIRIRVKAGYCLGSVAVLPIVFDVACSTHADQVGECVSFFVSIKSKAFKRDDMSNRKFFRQFVTVLVAGMASMTVTVSSLVALLSPIRSIVGFAAAFPVRTIFSFEVLGKPFKATFITTKTLGSFTRPYLSFFAAILAFIGDTFSLLSRIALLGTILSLAECRRNFKGLIACVAGNLNFVRNRFDFAYIRAINALLYSGWFTKKRFLTESALLGCSSISTS